MGMGDIIKELRIKRGMTQEELAEAVGYSHKSSINKIEQGKTDISQPKIAAIAEALGVTPDYLFYGTEESEPQPVGYDQLKQFTDIISTMSEEEKADLMKYMNFIVSQRN